MAQGRRLNGRLTPSRNEVNGAKEKVLAILILVTISAGLCLLLTRIAARLLWPALAATLAVGAVYSAFLYVLLGARIVSSLRIAVALSFLYAGIGAAVPALWIALARWGNREEERSEEDRADDDQRRKRTRRVLLLGAAAILLILVVGVVAFRIVVHNRVQQELAEIRAEGFPVILQELNAWYPQPPAGQNAADVYQKAFALFAGEKGKYEALPKLLSGKLPPFGEPLPAEVKALLAAYVAENREALSLLHQATAMPLCRFPVDFTKAFQPPAPRLGIQGWLGSTDPPYWSGLRVGVFQLLASEAILHADDRREAEAAQAIAGMIGAGRSLGNEPLTQAQGMRTAYQTWGMLYFQRVLSRTALSDENLHRIDDLLKDAVNLDGMTRSIAAARCMGSAAFTDPKAGAPLAEMLNAHSLPPISWRLRCLGLLDMDHLLFLRFTRQFLADWQEYKCKGGLFDTRQRPVPSAFPHGPVQMLSCSFSFYFLVAWPLYDSNFTALIAEVELGRTGIAVERFSNAQGRLPGDLSELVPTYLPAVPLDPWDGKPVRYRRLAKGYVIYSVGRDGKGDGENADTDKDFNGTTFRVAR